MNGSAPPASAFTLIELVAVLALAAVLSAGASLSLSGTGRRAQFRDTFDQIAGVDQTMRDAARRSGAAASLVVDLGSGALRRAADSQGMAGAALAELSRGVRIEQIVLADRREGFGEVRIDYSSRGLSRSYAVLLAGPDRQRQWLGFAGLTGRMTLLTDADVDHMLE